MTKYEFYFVLNEWMQEEIKIIWHNFVTWMGREELSAVMKELSPDIYVSSLHCKKSTDLFIRQITFMYF